MRLAIIGGGKMGEAILSRVLAAAPDDPGRHAVVEVDPSRRSYLADHYQVRVGDDPAGAVEGADIVLLAIKPQDARAVYQALGGSLHSDQVLASIMAGVSLATIREGSGHQAVVRAMPNTPAAIGEGFTVWTATPEVSAERRAEIRALFADLGPELFVADEKYLDMATAINGSGPAFVYLFVEALCDAAVGIGLPRPMALNLVLQTVRGSAAYVQATGLHPAQLKNDVTSPAGTTASGLSQLERHGFRVAVNDAVAAAYQRSKELGNA